MISTLAEKNSQEVRQFPIWRHATIQRMLGYVSYVNALEMWDLYLLSAWQEIFCLNFARSPLKSERTKC